MKHAKTRNIEDIRQRNISKIPIKKISGIKFFRSFLVFWNKKPVKITLGSFLVLLVIVWVGNVIVRAEIARFYPSQCNGDWDRPEASVGASEVADPTDAAQFTESNSAVWKSGANKTIICGNFGSDVTPGRILRVRLHLSWMFKTPSVIAPSVSGAAASPESLSPAGETPATDTPIMEVPTTTETVSPSTTLQEPVPEIISPPFIPATESTSSSAWHKFFIKTVFAQNDKNVEGVPLVSAALIFNGIENFLNIEYTLDGERWEPVNNSELEMPFADLGDLQKVKIRVTTLREGQGLPEIYLDALWFETTYVPEENTPSEAPTSSSAFEAITSAISDIPNVVADAVEAGVQNVSDFFENPPIEVTSVVLTVPVQNQEIRVESIRKFSFENQHQQDASIMITVNGAGDSLVISGLCETPYVAALLFRKEEDATRDPARAIVNRATSCVDQRFEFTITTALIPTAFADGDYFLLLGDQEKRGTWTPRSSMQRITMYTVTSTLP